MRSQRFWLRLSGWTTLAVFVIMAVLIRLKIAPIAPNGFLPQTAWRSYSEGQLSFFAAEIGIQAGQLYTFILAGLDTVFAIGFGVFVALFLAKPNGDLRVTGLLVAVLYTGMDLGENAMILRAVSPFVGGAGWVLYPPLPEGQAVASYFTTAKFLLLGVCGVLILGQIISRRQG